LIVQAVCTFVAKLNVLVLLLTACNPSTGFQIWTMASILDLLEAWCIWNRGSWNPLFWEAPVSANLGRMYNACGQHQNIFPHIGIPVEEKSHKQERFVK